MVRVRLLVRVIPEDVYLKDIESPINPIKSRANLQLIDEKRHLELVDNPENLSIGKLANNIKLTFQRINHDPLGNIKYLKDGEVDADLDPEMSVYDAFVDGGKAATEQGDQTATIKVIRELRGKYYGIREGSVVPDLNKPRFQPKPLPPVPRFSDINQSLGKRSRDDAFQDESSRGNTRHGSSSSRRRRLHPLQEIYAEDSPVPSIERDVHQPSRVASIHRQRSPIVIPETQDSQSRTQGNSRQDGSEILGDEEPKSESPEIAISIHSLPTAEKDNEDLEMLDSAPSREKHVTQKDIAHSTNPSHVHTQTDVSTGLEPTSRSPSNYYSPTSGSSHSVLREPVTAKASASKYVGDESAMDRARGAAGLTKAKASLVQDGNLGNGPITPISGASRDTHTKADQQAPNHGMANGMLPPSRTSSFSYKFRRDDRVPSAESEIDDSQMSPRSRKSLKRSRNARQSREIPTNVSIRELSGLFHHAGEHRPLIQEQKRQRKDTIWDFSEHVDDLSESEDEKIASNQENIPPNESENRNEAQECAPNGGFPGRESSDAMPHRMSKSRALSDRASKDSNASTERPITYTSQNPLSVPRPLQNRQFGHDKVSNIVDRSSSDKENEADVQLADPGLALANNQDVDMQQDMVSEEQEMDHVSINNKQNAIVVDDSVVGINDLSTTETDLAPISTMGRLQGLPGSSSQSLNHSSSVAEQPPRKARSRKKKSRLQDDDTISKADSQASTLHSARSTTNKVADNPPNVVARLETHNVSSRLTEPDKQLSQDLQESARAGNKNSVRSTKNGEASSGKKDRKGREIAENSKGGTLTGPLKRTLKTSKDAAQQTTSFAHGHATAEHTIAGRYLKSDIEVDMMSGTSTKTRTQEKSQDGKLGLGFSQSPTGKTKPILHFELLDDDEDIDDNDDGQDENLERLPNQKDNASFLKKSRSVDKLHSSQSFTLDTPTRSPPPVGKKDGSQIPRNLIENPKSASNVPFSSKTVKSGGGGGDATRAIVNVSESESEPTSDEDSSIVPRHRNPEASQAILKNGEKNRTSKTANPSIGIVPVSSRSEADAMVPTPPPIKRASKVDKGNEHVIVKIGDNVYSVDGAPVLVPPGFTIDTYLSMRADLAVNPPKQSFSNRNRSSAQSATPILNGMVHHSSSPVPTLTKAAPKKAVTTNKTEKESAKGGKKEKGMQQNSSASTAKAVSKKVTGSSKTNHPASSSSTITATTTTKAAPDVEANNPVRKTNQQPPPPPPVKQAISAHHKSRPPPIGPPPTSNSNKAIAYPPAPPKPTNPPLFTTGPVHQTEKANHHHHHHHHHHLDSLIAHREAVRAGKAATATKSSGKVVTPGDLVNGRKIFGLEESDSESESESESETESETDSSEGDDGGVGGLKKKMKTDSRRTLALAAAAAKVGSRGGVGKVDLSIRDQSPVSGGEGEEDEGEDDDGEDEESV